MRSRSIRMSRAAGNSPPKLQKYRNFTPAVPRCLSFSPFSAVFADETCLLSVYAPPAPCRIAPSRACTRAPVGGFLVCVRGKKFASAARWAYSHSGADAYLTRQSSCRVGDRVSNTRLRRRGTGGCIAPIRVFRLPGRSGAVRRRQFRRSRRHGLCSLGNSCSTSRVLSPVRRCARW